MSKPEPEGTGPPWGSELTSLRPRRILLIKPSSLGDVVDALPVAAGLRERYPKAHVAWLAKPEYAGLVACSPDVDEVVDLPGDGGLLGRWRGLRGAVRAVRRGAFDLAVDLQGLFRSGWIGWAGRVPVRVGLASSREGARFFYTHTVSVPTMEMHAVERYWLAARALGCAAVPRAARLTLPEAARQRIDVLLGDVAQPSSAAGTQAPAPAPGTARPGKTGRGTRRPPSPQGEAWGEGRGRGPLVALLPGARWRTKCWPAERFGPVADALVERTGARVVVAGGENDRDAAQAIGDNARGDVLDLVGRTDLVELAVLLSRAALVVCVDSGPMHLAAALGRPVVAIFGPTNPVRTGPYGRGHTIVTAGLDCQPCYRRHCRHVRCLEAVTAEEVSAAAVASLGDIPKPV